MVLLHLVHPLLHWDPGAKAAGTAGVGIGMLANATKDYSIAIGGESSSTADNSIAIGRKSSVSENDGIAIGTDLTQVQLNRLLLVMVLVLQLLMVLQ